MSRRVSIKGFVIISVRVSIQMSVQLSIRVSDMVL